MSCGCNAGAKEGKELVDHIRSKGKEAHATLVTHEFPCSCGEKFTIRTAISQCPHCKMTYAVTPCGSEDIKNIKSAGINY